MAPSAAIGLLDTTASRSRSGAAASACSRCGSRWTIHEVNRRRRDGCAVGVGGGSGSRCNRRGTRGAASRTRPAPAPICRRLFWHCERRAASRAACTAGSSSATSAADDRDDDEQLDEREAARGARRRRRDAQMPHRAEPSLPTLRRTRPTLRVASTRDARRRRRNAQRDSACAQGSRQIRLRTWPVPRRSHMPPVRLVGLLTPRLGRDAPSRRRRGLA